MCKHETDFAPNLGSKMLSFCLLPTWLEWQTMYPQVRSGKQKQKYGADMPRKEGKRVHYIWRPAWHTKPPAGPVQACWLELTTQRVTIQLCSARMLQRGKGAER